MSAAQRGVDWGLGRYERTAGQLLPAAEAVVETAAPRRGERVVDLGCGTGNAAVLAAERGATVVGVDPAERLLGVSRERAEELGLDASFAIGEAAAIPLQDGAADLILSVFAVIFAPDAEAAAAEMARVLSSRGRLVISAWIPEGALMRATRFGREAVARALGAPPPAPGFPWHDPAALGGLLEPYGLQVETEVRSIAFTAPSAGDFVEAEARNHPLQVAAASVLDAGRIEEIKAGSRRIFEEANEDPAAFRVTSRYVVAVARRD